MEVSILIPTYNRGYVLGQALESALRQTYQDFEILVINDGSTDNTLEVLKSFPSKKIRLIEHPQNRGCSAAYNTGILAAAAPLVAMLDSDDLWKPNYLERQVDFLARHPEADAVFSDLEIVGETKQLPSLTSLMRAFPNLLQQKPPGEEFVFDQMEMYLCLLEELPIKPSACVIRRTILDKTGIFNETWPSGTDWDLLLRISRISRFGYINLPLAIQKWSPDATHRKYWEKDKLFLIGIFDKEKQNSKRSQECVNAINRGLLKHYSDLALFYLTTGRRAKSIATYFTGFEKTHSVGMLLRAGAALAPLSLREHSKRWFRKTAAPKYGLKAGTR